MKNWFVPVIRRTAGKVLFLVIILVTVLLFPQRMMAQPFLDVVTLKYTNSPNAGLLNPNKNAVRLQYFSIGTNLPLQFKNKKNAIVFSPYFEKWWSQIIYNPKQGHYSIALPVSFIKSFPQSKWSILLNATARLNDSSISKRTNMQVGGAILVSYKRTENLSWKLGIYVNNELFGVFVMPLAGIDWKINERNNLFGVLPGNLTYEHKINEHFYYGANFRAITNSYGNITGYWRIDENQLGIYLDSYLSKNIVLNLEAGHSVLRKLRTGIKNTAAYDAKVNDNLYFKLSLAYRVRFSKR